MKKYVLIFSFYLYTITGIAQAKDSVSTDWMALFIGGAKSGYMKVYREVKDKRVTSIITMHIQLNRGPNAVSMTSSEQHIETIDGKPLSFLVEISGAGTEQVIKGKVNDNGTVEIKKKVGTKSNSITKPWPKGALLAEGLRILQLQKGISKGLSYVVKCFQASVFDAPSCKISFGDREKVNLFGRITLLTEMKTEMQFQGTSMVTTSYVDEDLTTMKTIMPLMGMELTLIACDSVYATSNNEPNTFFKKIIVSSPKKLPEKLSTKIVYKISPIDSVKKLSIVSTDEQTVKESEKDNYIEIVVQKLEFLKGESLPYKGEKIEAKKALKPGLWIQSDNNKVIELAKKVIEGEKNSFHAAKKIESFVHSYMTNKNLSVGYASAAEVVISREGDCTEHAVLTAAMCRAVGIPAKVALGIAYTDNFLDQKDVFVPHAWTQVFIQGKWYSIDAALGSSDARRITFKTGDGAPSEFFGQINTIGNIKITSISF